MATIATQMVGLALLLAGVGWGYRWATYGRGPLHVTQQGILLLTLLTLTGGFVGAIPWWLDQASSFAWDLPPLASRLLAAAGWAFALACLRALRHPTKGHLRLIMLMLTIYLLPLALAILRFHLDRFAPNAPITYAFFAIVGTMTPAALWFLLRPVGVTTPTKTELLRPTRLVQIWLGLVAVLTGTWGIALFLTAQGPIPLIWVWPQDLLASRLIAVMLLTIAGAALYSLRHADLARTTLATILLYGIGVAVAGLWNLTASKAVPVAYVTTFALFALFSALLLATGSGIRHRPARAIPPQYELLP